LEDSGKSFIVQTDEKVYSPSEDSYLLLDSMKVPRSSLVLDMGTGTGILAIGAALLGASKVVAIDVNPFASKCALKNVISKGLKNQISVLIGDLFSSIRKNAMFDAILFNPPYLRTSKSEYAGDWLEKSWAGGRNGMVIINQFINRVSVYLKPEGLLFILLPSRGISATNKKLRRMKMSATVVAKRRLFFEEIVVLLVKHTYVKKHSKKSRTDLPVNGI
jgi:release factor glutamine methyltransferase